MVLVVVLMLVVAGLALALTAAVTQRTVPTLYLQKSTQTVAAAQAGLDTALAQLRAAAQQPDTAGNVFGDATALPCSAAGAAGDGLAYSVSLSYFTQDPTGQSTAWRASNQLPWCGAGAQARTTVPRYAVMTSRGSGKALPGTSDAAVGDRVLEAVYTFQVTTKTVLGGLLLTFDQGFCVQAGPASSGSSLTYVRRSDCSDSNPLQLFQWGSDYTIRLSSRSQGSTSLCLTGGTSGDVTAALRACDPSRPDQLFGFDDLGSRLRNENAANTSLTGNCLWAGATGTDLSGRTLRSSADCSADNQAWGSWAPAPRFGAGAASYATGQVVSYAQTGRCFDITGHRLDAGYDIVYPCKSDPSGRGQVPWNHRISYTRPSTTPTLATQITVKAPDVATTYCFTAPDPTASAPAFPRMSPCTGSASGPQVWKRTEVDPSTRDSYTFKDVYGRCLDIGPVEGQLSWDYYSPWSRMVVAACNGQPSQKWNAPADLTAASVTGLRELPRGS